MCFNLGTHTSIPKAKTAKTDILCYKVVETSEEFDGKLIIRSMLQGHIYKLGKLETATFGIRNMFNNYTIHAGLHSYTRASKAKICLQGSDLSDKIMVCIIPKGTRYYENETEFCSDKLIPVLLRRT